MTEKLSNPWEMGNKDLSVNGDVQFCMRIRSEFRKLDGSLSNETENEEMITSFP